MDSTFRSFSFCLFLFVIGRINIAYASEIQEEYEYNQNIKKTLDGPILREGECTKTGRQCSADCKLINLCTLVGEPPILVKTCYNDTATPPSLLYCNSAATPIDCTETSAVCSSNPNVKITCTGFGEFPHPTLLDSTVQCTSQGPPAAICKCSKDLQIALKPGLPCETPGTREPVKCDEPGKSGPIEAGTGYCYACGNDEILLYYCPGSKNIKFSFPFSRAADKTCAPPA